MADEETVVADPEPAAPAAEPEAKPPEAVSPPAAQPESESGDGQGTEAEQFKAFLGRITDPQAANAVIEALRPEVRAEAAIIKEERGRGRQSGRAEVLNERALAERDKDDHVAALARRDEALAALSAAEPSDVARHAKTLRTAAEEVHDYELRQDIRRTIGGTSAFSSYGDEEIERLRRVDGADMGRWFREHLDTFGDVRERQGYERGVAEAQSRAEADRKLQEQLTAPERPEGPPRVPAGGPSGESTFEQLEALVANRTATPEQVDAYKAECRRLGIIS